MILKKRTFLCIALLSAAFGLRAQTAQQWRDSLSAINKQIASSAYSLDLHLRKAAINIELQQWEYAINEYNDVLAKYPRNLTALYFRAFANSQLLRYRQSCDDYKAIIRLVPLNFEARMGLSYVLQKMNKPKESLNELNQLVELFPDSIAAYVSRAALEKDMKLYDLALFDWEEAIRRNPNDANYLISKVDILLLMKRKSEAFALLRRMEEMGVSRAALKEWLDRCK